MIQSGQVDIQLTGVDASVYSLPSSILTFNVIPATNSTPEITDIQLLQVTQTTATIQFTSSEIATAWWMVSLVGTAQPTLAQLQSFGPAQ